MSGVERIAATSATSSRLRRGPRGILRDGVAPRLVALTLAPLVALVTVGTFIVRDAQHSASAARAVETGGVAVRALTSLLDTIEREYGMVELQARAASFGLSASQLAAAIHSPTMERAATVAATDRALAAAEAFVPAAFAPTLTGVRAQLAGAHADIDALSTTYGRLAAMLDEPLHARLAALQSRVDGLSGGRATARAVEGLDAASRLLRSGTAQVNDLSRAVFGPRAAQGPLIVMLGHDGALYTDAVQRLVTLHLGGVSRVAAATIADPSVQALQTLVDGVQRGGQLPNPASLVSLPGNPLGGITLLENTALNLVGATRTLLAREAHQLRLASESRYRLTTGGIALAALLSIVLALWIARTITRPLGRLNDTAHAVTDGCLDVTPLRVSGPHETRTVASAFNDLVGNLRLLEAKSQALADCDLTNPVLAEPLPGRLGESIQTSVQLLSGSIEDRDELQRTLARQATHDALTGMNNRAAAITMLDQALARSRRSGDPVAVVFIDLDGFKPINDAHGHEVGDQVLQMVSTRMQQALREGDAIARLGGDEFVVIAERISVDDATALAQRIIAVVSEPMTIGKRELAVGTSVGLAFARDGNETSSQCLAHADLALYRAKEHGRGRIELFDESLQLELVHRLDVEQGLRATLARGGEELMLFYQPVLDACGDDVTGVEALVRWDRAGTGTVFPDDFIPIAEASNLIIDLDRWVLATATRQAVAWTTVPGFEHLPVSVNVSGRHLLSGQLYESVRTALAEAGLEPSRLTLEITETVLLSDIPIAAEQLQALRDLGVRIAIDDFGTGYTSVGMLHGLPIDVLKVDRSFVSHIDEARDRSLVAMMTRLGHELGVTIVAEGVETCAQRSTLTELGCDKIQGYLISRPVPAPQLQARYAPTSTVS